MTIVAMVWGVAAKVGGVATILTMLQTMDVSATPTKCGICEGCTQVCRAYLNDTVNIDCREDESTTEVGLSYTIRIDPIQTKSCKLPDPCIISLPAADLHAKAFKGKTIHLECLVSSDHKPIQTVAAKPITLNFIKEPWAKLSTPSANLVAGESLRLICALEKGSRPSNKTINIFDSGLKKNLTQKFCACQTGNEEINKTGGHWRFQTPANTKVSRSCSCLCKEEDICHVVLEIDRVKESDQGNYSCTATARSTSLSSFAPSSSNQLSGFTWVSVVSPHNQFCQINVSGYVEVTPLQPCVQVTIQLTPKNFDAEVKITKIGDNTTMLDVCSQSKKCCVQIGLENAGEYMVGCYSKEGTLIQHKTIMVSIKVKPRVNAFSLVNPTILDNIYLIDKHANPTIQCKLTSSPPTSTSVTFSTCNNSQILATNQTSSSLKITLQETLPHQSHGEVKCSSTNQWGSHHQTLRFARLPRDARQWPTTTWTGLTLLYNTSQRQVNEGCDELTVVEHDDVVMTCRVVMLAGCSHDINIQWWSTGQSKSVGDRVPFSDNEAIVSLRLDDVSTADKGEYQCLVYRQNQNFRLDSQTLDIERTLPPYFANASNEGYREDIAVIDTRNNITWRVGKQLKIECNIQGRPEPTRTWLKDGREIIDLEGKNGKRIEGKLLVFKSVELEDSGNYTCIGRDPRLRLQKEFYTGSWVILKVKDDRRNSESIYIVFLLLLLLLLVLVIVGWHLKAKQNKKLSNQLSKATIELFEKGNIEAISKDRDVVEQADLLPYDKSIEFPFEKLQFDKMIGSGAYGKVWKGTAAGLTHQEAFTTVAIKTVNRTANMDHLQALMMELKIMQHLGKHPNVVSLLGACTVNLIRKELFMILEYCQYGSLQLYLRNNRENFQNQIKPEEDLDMRTSVNSGAYMPMKAGTRSSTESRRTFSVGLPNSMRMSIGTEDPYGMVMSNETVATTLGSMTDRRSEPSWRSSWIPDYGANGQTITTTQDLLAWTCQVARGMEFLGTRKLLHGDLAARNVLLTSEKVAKICDFGLSRSVYKNPEYVKSTETPMPVKWMAVESIEDGIFSIQSDVWAFGITIWEIFELSKVPYGGIQVDENFIKKLNDGFRLAKPNYAPKALYEVMLDCWNLDPNRRPTFTSIGDSVEQILRDMGRHEAPLTMRPSSVGSSNPKDFLHLFVDPVFNSNFGIGKRSSVQSGQSQKWLLDFDQNEEDEITPATPLMTHSNKPLGTEYLIMRKQDSAIECGSSEANACQRLSGTSETRPYQRLSRNGEAYCLKDEDIDQNILVITASNIGSEYLQMNRRKT